jgi:hypothetical protein
MNEYQAQAQEFLDKTGTKLYFSYVKKRKQSEVWGDKESKLLCTELKVTLENKRGKITFPFFASHKDTIDGAVFSEDFKNDFAYHALAALDIVPDTFKDFCDCFGYDDDSIRALETFKKCVDMNKKLRKIFSSEELELLAEIN